MSKMPDNKQQCKACKTRHLPPTGKKCKRKVQEQTYELSSDAAVAGLLPAEAAQPVHDDGQRLQTEILQQLKKVTERLDQVEQKVAVSTRTSTPTELSTDTFLESIKSSKRRKSKPVPESSSSSSDESDEPTLEVLKSHHLQQKVDKRIRELVESSHSQGNQKFKSQRGGEVEVQVKHKVHWPHEAILGGTARQRVTYDQLSLTQWVQGFCRNILEEKSGKRKDLMVAYLGDLMEDATDFSWQGAKAAHAVLMCEMERGSVRWEDTERLDRIRRAHAQKHIPTNKQNWARGDKKPWFCKNFQTNACAHKKDHESNGRLHKHICAFCLANGRQLNHSEKNCMLKSSQAKNDTAAAHH